MDIAAKCPVRQVLEYPAFFVEEAVDAPVSDGP